MRFAGTRIEGLLGSDRPEYGALAQKGLANRTQESTAATDLMGKTAATGIAEAGRVEAANITGAAQASLAQAQGNAAIMEGIGGIASSAIGAFGGGGGGGASGLSNFSLSSPTPGGYTYSGAPIKTSGMNFFS